LTIWRIKISVEIRHGSKAIEIGRRLRGGTITLQPHSGQVTTPHAAFDCANPAKALVGAAIASVPSGFLTIFKKEMTMWIIVDAALFAAGYAASIYSWPAVKIWINGLSAEVVSLRARATALEAKIRTL
jgi:hypothetical protein